MEFIVKIRARMDFDMLEEILEDIDIEKVYVISESENKVDKNLNTECPRCDALSPEVAVFQNDSTHECPNCGRFKITHDGDIAFMVGNGKNDKDE